MEQPAVRHAYRDQRHPGASARRDGDAAPDDEAKEQDERALLCAACGATVTNARHAVEISCRHRHTCFNPHGVLYEVRCFGAAPGCRDLGEASEEFSWFPGYAWRVSVCAGCEAHLGWAFANVEGAGFWGLIHDRLVES